MSLFRKKRTHLAGITILTPILLMAACLNDSSNSRSTPQWLAGATQEKWKTLDEHFGGFHHTMVEVGYRFSELYWAGEDENWDYAEYQAEEMEEALELGIARRPNRGESAEMFFPALKRVESSIEARNLADFRVAFQGLTNACNTCHQAEDKGFLHVGAPSVRLSSIIKPKESF
jgi:hypothetical protein